MYNRLKSRKNKIEYRYAWWGREGTPQISALIKKIEPVCKNSSSTTARSVWKKVKKNRRWWFISYLLAKKECIIKK